MFRLVGISRAIREGVPPELAPVFWVVTLFGSAEFLLIALSLAYWNLQNYRSEVLRVVGIAFVALSVTLALKYWYALPRPPAAVQRYPITPDGFGFPSGHAIAATVIYGGLLVVTDRLRDPQVAIPVGAAVLLIGLSRVILGVHYLGDVLVGFAVGLVVLGAAVLVAGENARALFAAGAVLSAAALVTSGLDPDALLAAGGSVGALLGMSVPGRIEPFRFRSDSPLPRRVAVNAAGLVAVALALLVDSLTAAAVPLFLANLGLVFAIVALPHLIGQYGTAERDTTA